MSSSDDAAGAGQPSEPKRTSGLECHGGVGYSSLFSFRFPQCISLRSVNVRSMFRFKARNTPMRACITKSRPSAVCHSSRFCSALGSFHDIRGSVLEGHELAPVGQRYRVIELSRPAKPGLHPSGRNVSGAR